MTIQEFATIAAAIKAAYPAANIMPDKQSKDVWYTMLADLEYRVCLNALKKHISTNRFPPTIAELRRGCADILAGPDVDWSEAWGRVLLAVRRDGMYNEPAALERMGPEAAKIVKRLGFKNICMSENIEVERANFRMAWETEQRRRKEDLAIPEKVMQEIQTTYRLQRENLIGIGGDHVYDED